MTQDFYQRIQEQLSQAMQEQAVLVQENAVQASHDFISSMREVETMKGTTQEEMEKIRQRILNLASCDECSQPAKDDRKCDNCGDVLCEDCCHYDEGIAFCFECYMDRQSWYDEY